MFAVLKTGGKQYKVAAGDVLKVERLVGEAGETVQFNDILMLGGDKLTVGAPMIADAGVQATILEQAKAPKVIHYVKRRRKHSSQRTKGHRQKLTVLRVTEILAKGADKSGVQAAIGTGSAPAAAVVAENPAVKKAAPKAAAAKAEKAPAAKTAAAKKPAAKKPAAKKAAKPAADSE